MMVGGSSSCQAGDKTGAAQLWPAEDNRTAWRPETADQGGDHQDEAGILFQVLNVDIWSHLNK